MFAEISAAASSAKIALELVKAANKLANYNELVAAVSEVNAKLMDATVIALASQEKQSTLADEVRALKQELVERENWERESQNYTLQAVGVEGQHFAQVYKPTMQSTKARHWACAKCFQEQKMYPLSAHKRFSYKCANCGTEISPIIPGGNLAPIESAY